MAWPTTLFALLGSLAPPAGAHGRRDETETVGIGHDRLKSPPGEAVERWGTSSADGTDLPDQMKPTPLCELGGLGTLFTMSRANPEDLEGVRCALVAGTCAKDVGPPV